MQLPGIPLVVLDTETTGLLPRVNRIIEFASVLLRDGVMQDEYEQLIFVEEAIPPHVEVLTRIKTADLQGKPRLEDVRGDILKHIDKDAIIVGQNITYDMEMLKGEGIDLSGRPWIDTSMLASLVFPEFESYSLGYMSTVLSLNHEPMHRALGDVHATVELLSRCWERMLMLPRELQMQAQDIMRRAPEGYRRFFGALPAPHTDTKPVWLHMGTDTTTGNGNAIRGVTLTKPSGSVALLEEPASPGVLEIVMRAAVADSNTVHWLAVKNLEMTTKKLTLPEGVRILFPPYLLLDPEAGTKFIHQESFTANEATLALKLLWYTPETQSDLPLHGDEVTVWNGKLACTEESAAYTRQFLNPPGVLLLDHRQLLSFIADPKHTGHNALTTQAHIVIDDASMLEDTATKAYEWYCPLPHLRAAAEGNEILTKLADITELWAERTRGNQDLHYLTVSDLQNPDARGMRDLLDEALQNPDLPRLALRYLSHLQQILRPENLKDRIVYIELRYSGDLHIHSAPEQIGIFLQRHLYDVFPTTLLVPPGSANTLKEVLPAGTKTAIQPAIQAAIPFEILYPEHLNLNELITTTPEGKTIVLMSSKRSIDDVYIKHAEALEKRGISLICQGLCGGAGRMRANFIAAQSPALWFLTPWAFEGITLPANTADRLVLFSLPFDHPSHAVLSKRAEHYQNAFMQYSLARLQHRLFRLLRAFSGYCKEGAEVLLLDDRLHTKNYGKDILAYLSQFRSDAGTDPSRSAQVTLF
ncbi:hypothetical protein A2454_01855 [Candidatus Peribacteria bacterium RIFOXYC2_FULL_55_14]|nr:MAG: hypothetical protein A2198_06480 [Candidatus Peribacteria bacterium RIFOXYA1_FULL_56_14]OGJ73467.1 MAG: hypothetical protein A2217_02035 [Candidatus Peribacteria bacterium RIFOXYA2_FULL_55_28]OGJ74648.1 MAG: hypothetical protein A2384_03320 [Candidatus Peribacteria bacterium RIFOXYB1_FULL_54_35]OGJ76814.1 MAG: hypothetical protein A2327_06815 [Candidatus Peribacteria bacterium RIFOXYB2_FULL_54_17]OGJ78032.1 MAG: hypothetical protein A2424_05070 [Candidatus Peribacteria bacterium RIFOXYC